MIFLFEDYGLDAGRRELRRGSDIISVEPQVFDLLLLFVRNRNRVVSKEDMIADVWHGRIVSEAALYSRITAARRAIGDSGKTQRLIRTVARKGFRFVGDVRDVDALARDALVVRETAAVLPVADPTKPPTLVVMPFDNLSVPEDRYLVDGLVEDITLSLSRVRDFCVIARHSAIASKQSCVDECEAGRNLGARYIVSGTFQRDGDRLRVSVSLVDAEKSLQLWSERYEGVVASVFEFQDQIAGQVAGTLQPTVRHRELDLGRRKPPNSLTAYDCVLRGISIYHHGPATAQEAGDAIAWFDRALELDPHYARALAWRACAAASLWPAQPTQENLDRNMDLVSRALSIDPSESEAHRIKGALHTLQRHFDLATHHLEQALNLNPNDAHILVKGGLYLSYLGEPAKGLSAVDKALQRNPLHPAWYWRERGIVLFGLGADREALTALQRCHRGRDVDHVYQAACLVAVGDVESARACVRELRRTRPEVDLRWIRRAIPYRCYKYSADFSRLTDRLESAWRGS